MLKGYLRKINNMSASAKASFWFIISNIALKGISFITTPIFTRILDVADYGTTSVFVTWEGIISLFATLSLAGGVYNVALTKFQDDADAYTSCMYILESVLCVFVYSIVLIINKIFPAIFNLSSFFIVFMGIQTLTNAFSTFWLMRMRFNYKYKPVIAFSFANAIIGPCIAIAAIKMFPQNVALAKVVGAGVFGIVFGTIVFFVGIKNGRLLFSRKYWKYSIGFNLPLLPHYLSGILLGSADKIMIDTMISRVAAGIYSISNSIANCLYLVTNAINSIMIPVTLKAIRDNEYNGLKKKINSYMLIIAFCCVGIMLFEKEVVLLLASAKYSAAIPMVPPLLIAAFFEFASGIVGNIQFYYEKRWNMSLSTIICAIANIALNYVGLSLFGAIAATYTTLITSIMHFFLYYYFTCKCEKNIKQIINLPLLLITAVGLAVIAILALVFENAFVVRMLAAIIPITIAIRKRKYISSLLKK